MEADANQISCNFPIAYATDAGKGKIRVVFISGANVTRVRKQFFKQGNAGTSGIFAIVSFNGKTYISDKTILTDYIVLPSVVEARPVNPDLCPRRHRGGPEIAQLESATAASGPVVSHDIKNRIVKPAELEQILANQESVFGNRKGGELKLEKKTD